MGLLKYQTFIYKSMVVYFQFVVVDAGGCGCNGLPTLHNCPTLDDGWLELWLRHVRLNCYFRLRSAKLNYS